MAAAFKYKIRMNIILFLIILILGPFISISRSYYFIFQTQDYDEGLLDRPLTTTAATIKRRRRLLPLSSSSSSSYGDNNIGSDTGGHHRRHQPQEQEQKQRQTMTTIHRDNNNSSSSSSSSSSRTAVVNDKNSIVDDIRGDDIHDIHDEENENEILISRPNDTNTAVILIAMGSKVVNDTWLTERCVRSIRMGGQYNGYVIIITDKEGYNKYTETLLGGDNNNNNNNNNNKVIIMETKTEDISPKNKNGSNIRYYKKRTHMLYKRYKTLALKYLEYAFEFDNNNNKNNNNSSTSTSTSTSRSNKIIEHVLYLDVDNIVARPLSIFFNDYYNSINSQLIEAKKRIITTTTTTTTTQQQQQQQSNSENSDNSPSNSSSKNAKLRATANANTNDFSFFSFWKDPHVKHKGVHLWQSGQIMFSTKHSNRCLDAWRYEMDNKKHVMDQALLFNVYTQNFTESRCLFFELPNNITEDNSHHYGTDNNNNNDFNHGGKHFQLFSKEIAKTGDVSQYPTIVHLTKMRLDRISQKTHQLFLRKSLLLDNHHHPLLLLVSNDTTTTTEVRNENDVVIIKRNNNNTNTSMTNDDINWNNQTISWNEITESFVDHSKEKKKEKNKK